MSNLTVKGNASGTGTVILEAPNTNSNRTITLPDATATLASTAYVDSSVATAARMVAGTAVSSTSGTAIDFTGIPSWAKRVTVMLSGVSFDNSPSFLCLRIGTSSGIDETNDYVSSAGGITSANAVISSMGTTTVFYLTASSGSFGATTLFSGAATLVKISGNRWSLSGSMTTASGLASVNTFSGVKNLSADLDRVRVLPGAGVNFDAGTINILYEG